jgi:D-arabinose 1-dehydrogenase-like Zn-dependent alcohol dehydrogenase
MKAAVIPAVRSKWEVKEIPTPEVGPNQVLIKIHASGLCYTDVHVTEGHLPEKWLPKFPCTIGHEPVGEIVSVGTGVRTRKVGDRVGVPWLQASCGRCEWCLRKKPEFCKESIGTGGAMQGGHAEFMLAYADATMPLPEKLSYEQAAPIFCAGYTVWSGLRIADPKPHERIAILGIGGLGHLAVQYSKAAGFETIGITHSPDKKKLIKELGADEVFENGESLGRSGGADVILATSNSYKATAEAVKGLRPDGRLVLMGLDNEPLMLSGEILAKRVRIISSIQNGPEYLYEALDYAAKGKVKVMAETYPLAQIAKAYERVSSGDVRFRAVITN